MSFFLSIYSEPPHSVDGAVNAAWRNDGSSDGALASYGSDPAAAASSSSSSRAPAARPALRTLSDFIDVEADGASYGWNIIRKMKNTRNTKHELVNLYVL